MAPNDGANSTIHRQLAPTVGPATPRVTFRDGVLGGIGETITVRTAVFSEEGGYIVNDDSYIPANDYLISACIFPIGVHNIFVGMTPDALGLLMHVKCIDEFCIFSHGFLLHIASYKGIIQCFIVFSNLG